MNLKRSCLLILLIALGALQLQAQELNCQVKVISNQIQGSDKRIFENLEKAIFEFMNNTRWTKDVFKPEERIECSLLFNITDRLSTDEFKGTLQVQCRRPVFNTSYNSVLMNYNDNDIQFKYLEFQPIEYSENANVGNLSSILAYYAYVFIALDYDSFSLNGGTPYFNKALAIVNNSQNVQEKGWKAFEDQKNRFWLVSNALDPIFAPIRVCWYEYHRQGLDVMSNNKDDGRAKITNALGLLEKVHNIRPMSFNMQVFFNAKSDEIVNLYSEAFPDEKGKLQILLTTIDPANSNKYAKITAN